MNTCRFQDFMQMLKPWLNDDFIRRVRLSAEGTLTVLFADGGSQTYHIDDCTAEQLENTIEHMKAQGVDVIS